MPQKLIFSIPPRPVGALPKLAKNTATNSAETREAVTKLIHVLSMVLRAYKTRSAVGKGWVSMLHRFRVIAGGIMPPALKWIT